MRKSLWVVIAFVYMFVVSPVSAYADDGFIGGLQDFFGEREVQQVSPESDFIESYERQDVILSVPSTTPLDEDASTVDYVNNTLVSFNSVPWAIGNRSLIDSIYLYLTNINRTTQYLTIAVCLVFVYWGARKAIRMIFAAFRKGKISA